MEISSFGKLADGSEVKSYTFSNDVMTATVLNYGATLQSLKYKGKDVVLGYDDLPSYINHGGRLGATIGRCANRISGGKFKLNGKKYHLYKAKGESFSKHGGKVGFDQVIWKATTFRNGVVFKYFSPDKEEGYPGNLAVEVKYTLKKNGLKIEYSALSDKDTVLNLTNHTYFNLVGGEDVLNHFLKLECDYFTPVSKKNIPTGSIVSVDGTPFDFRYAKAIGKDISNRCEQLKFGGGYDHNFVINGEGFRKFAELSSGRAGIVMKAYTDMEGVQLYTANSLSERVGKNGEIMKERYGVCLETQAFPNAINTQSFKSPILKANENFKSTTEFTFEDFFKE